MVLMALMYPKSDPSRVLTLDSDFLIYRRHGRKVIALLMPMKG